MSGHGNQDADYLNGRHLEPIEADKPSVEGLMALVDSYRHKLQSSSCNPKKYAQLLAETGQAYRDIHDYAERLASAAAPAAHVNRTVAINATHWPPGETGLWVAVCPDAAAGPYPTAMRPATPEEARAMQTRVAAPAEQPATPLREVPSDELAQFEAHAKENGLYLGRCHDDSVGDLYASSTTEEAWCAWQARALLAASSDEAPKDPYGY